MCFDGFARGRSTIFVYSVEAGKKRRDKIRELGLQREARLQIEEFSLYLPCKRLCKTAP